MSPKILSPLRDPRPHRKDWRWQYCRLGVMNDYEPKNSIPDIIDRVWSDRKEEERWRNQKRAFEWKERLRWI